jgi:alpha-L-rhamnosidase
VARLLDCQTAQPKSPGVFYFRRELSLPKVPDHLWVHVSADNRFLLHVNGRYAAEGPARGDLFHWHFETVDLAPLLHAGPNIIAAVVWNFGDLSPVAQISNRTGFLLQADNELESALNTDKDWQVKQETGRAALPYNGVSEYYAAGPPEKIDGRLVDWSWDRIATDSSGWEAARIVGEADTRESEGPLPSAWELVQDPLPSMEHRLVEAGKPVRVEGLTALPDLSSAPVTIAANSHLTLLLDNRTLQTAYPEFTLTGGRDATIRLTYAESLYDANGMKGNRNEVSNLRSQGLCDEFTSDGGEAHVYQPLWWRTWRYLQIEVTTSSEALQLNSVRAWFTAYPFEAKAQIGGDVPRLQQIWDTGWLTARLCAHETYMDAPYWEQLQYVGDTRIQALISYVMTGDARLARQVITNIGNSRTPEGITQSRYPRGSRSSYLPSRCSG